MTNLSRCSLRSLGRQLSSGPPFNLALGRIQGSTITVAQQMDAPLIHTIRSHHMQWPTIEDISAMTTLPEGYRFPHMRRADIGPLIEAIRE